MTAEFKIVPHSDPNKSEEVVEIRMGGKLAGVIYPFGEKGIEHLSKQIKSHKLDPRIQTRDPVPALVVEFDPTLDPKLPKT